MHTPKQAVVSSLAAELEEASDHIPFKLFILHLYAAISALHLMLRVCLKALL
jgi:hypothetical protein